MSDEIPPSSDTGVSGWWSRLFQGRADEVKTREEIAAFLGGISRSRRCSRPTSYAMLQGVLEVSNTQVRDIMVPRSHMVVLAKDDPPEALLKTIIESNHSRFPVIGDGSRRGRRHRAREGRAQAIRRRSRRPSQIDSLLRPAVFIPESKRLNTLLAEFREGRNHMAIVVDEYGGVSGLATIEDVLEQIVGDIDDEHDPDEAASIQPQDGRQLLVLALTRIEDFNEFFGAAISDEEYDTVGGLVMHELGRLPRRGEQLEFGGFRFKVLRGDRRRLHTLEVTRLRSPPPSSGVGSCLREPHATAFGPRRRGAAARVRAVGAHFWLAPAVVRGADLVVARLPRAAAKRFGSASSTAARSFGAGTYWTYIAVRIFGERAARGRVGLTVGSSLVLALFVGGAGCAGEALVQDTRGHRMRSCVCRRCS